MKFSILALAAALLSAGAASAQTSPSSATQPNNSNPAAVPSGVAPVPADPKGNVTPGQVFTKGSPVNSDNKMDDRRRMKHKRMKGEGRMKTTM